MLNIAGFLFTHMAKGFILESSSIFPKVSWLNLQPDHQILFLNFLIEGDEFYSNEYPLFIPRQTYSSTSGENSWSDKCSSSFGVASLESERKSHLSSLESSSFSYPSAPPHSIETHKNLQKGIALLKKSVACVTSYCYNSLSLDVPSEASTFEAFAKLLATLSSSKEVRSVFSLKMASSRYFRPLFHF